MNPEEKQYWTRFAWIKNPAKLHGKLEKKSGDGKVSGGKQESYS